MNGRRADLSAAGAAIAPPRAGKFATFVAFRLRGNLGVNRWARAVLVLAALLLLVAATPAMRSSWVTLTHFHDVSRDGFYSLGTLTVTSCTHEPMPYDWTCRGNYQVTDPLGDAGHDRLDIPLANDFRRHSPGDRIDVATISPRESAAYLSGSDELARVSAFWLGVLAAVRNNRRCFRQATAPSARRRRHRHRVRASAQPDPRESLVTISRGGIWLLGEKRLHVQPGGAPQTPCRRGSCGRESRDGPTSGAGSRCGAVRG